MHFPSKLDKDCDKIWAYRRDIYPSFRLLNVTSEIPSDFTALYMNEYQYSQLSHMIWDTLTISVIEVDIKWVFSLSTWVVIVIWIQLSSEIIIDVMIYKNYFSWYKKEFQFFGNTTMFLGKKEVELELDSEEAKILNE